MTSHSAVEATEDSPAAFRKPVVLLTELFPPDVGGTPSLFENVYSRISARPVTVLTDTRDGASDTSMRVVRFPMSTPGHWGLASTASFGRHLRVARQLRAHMSPAPVVVHCARALPEGLSAWMATRVRRSSRYLCWTHGEELEYGRSSRELSALMHLVHKGASAVIANSHNTARALRALGVPSPKIHVVHPGVDVLRFGSAQEAGAAMRRRYAGGDDIVLLTVGRLQRRKGHDLAIEAVARIRSQVPGLKYVIVGDGEERPRLEAMVHRLRLDDTVTFAGKVDTSDLPACYAAADVFVHPNRVDNDDVEGFGIVFLEAAAAGLPVIGGNSGGVPEAVNAGASGVLVSGTDVGELANAMLTLALDRELRRRMGAEGRQFTANGFSWDRAADQVLSVHRLVERSSS